MAPHSPTWNVKRQLRNEVLGRRDAMSPEDRIAGSRRAAETIAVMPDLAGHAVVSAYWPIRSEIDPRPLIELLFARGQRVVLPKVTPDGLVFREWHRGERLVLGGFGLSEPRDDLPPLDPTAMIVPLAAFDRRGHRIGYGAGYYDRAIERLSRDGPPLTIGFAFATQEIAEVPAESHDRPLDHIVTEAGPVPLVRD